MSKIDGVSGNSPGTGNDGRGLKKTRPWGPDPLASLDAAPPASGPQLLARVCLLHPSLSAHLLGPGAAAINLEANTPGESIRFLFA